LKNSNYYNSPGVPVANGKQQTDIATRHHIKNVFSGGRCVLVTNFGQSTVLFSRKNEYI